MAESIITSTTDALLRHLPPLRRSARPADTHTQVDLADMLQSEIIPRLQSLPERRTASAQDLLPRPSWEIHVEHDQAFVHRTEPWEVPADVSSRDITILVAALRKQDLHAAWRLVKVKYDLGLGAQRIAVELLGGAARELGNLWENDRCSFADVTLGAGYLHQLMRDLFSSLDQASEVPGYHHRILLLPAPGEQHLLGLSILGESFRRSGWDVCGGPALDRAEPLDLIRREHFDVIGFSIGAERWLEPLAADLARFRQCSRNGHVRFLVGGRTIDHQPTLAGELGADMTVSDARDAPRAVLGLLPATDQA